MLWSVFPACAFTFSYGNLFDVANIAQHNGVLQMPLANGKYRNVKIASKALYDFIKQCEQDCTYKTAVAEFTAADYRKASTRDDMMVAEVDFNGEVQLTFLVFKNKDGFSVKFPADVVFKDKKLAAQVRKYLTELAAQTL